MQKKFRCRRCGECCRSSPKLSRDDIQRIIKFGIKKDFFVEKINKGDYMKIERDVCVFLEKNFRKTGRLYNCRIYEARPTICRLYPSEIRADCKPEKLAFDGHLWTERDGQS